MIKTILENATGVVVCFATLLCDGRATHWSLCLAAALYPWLLAEAAYRCLRGRRR